ncbi:hypothetical protein CEXT_704941 [Caerostris extrusa]|uniref:Kazal-like domain-containing protein n=1 Tax=Caerostris extrusa TaxID=172846 RepID=A0AAV4S8S1_CAEEX|nr:hypothetical protein CEXT_704941 [Caerostris extrusa]
MNENMEAIMISCWIRGGGFKHLDAILRYVSSIQVQCSRPVVITTDPCEGVECPATQVCQLDNHRNPICRCNAICSPDFRPVCGSDGKTYINECSLRVESCKSRRSLRIIFNGECSSEPLCAKDCPSCIVAFRMLTQGANPCENLQCGPGQECDIDRYGIATCQCPPSCEPVMRPVCGEDGVTYHSECDMRKSGCEVQKAITVQYRGACENRFLVPVYPFTFKCENGLTCRTNWSLKLGYGMVEDSSRVLSKLLEFSVKNIFTTRYALVKYEEN